MTSKLISTILLLCLIATNTHAEENTICQSEAACRTKFNTLNTNGLFYVDVKDGQFGCVLKGNNGFWNPGGSIEEQSTNDLPGSQERLYCDDDDDDEVVDITTTTGTTAAATTTAASEEEEEDEGTETPSYSPTKADEPEETTDNANGDASAATMNEDKSIATAQRLSMVGLFGCVVLAAGLL